MRMTDLSGKNVGRSVLPRPTAALRNAAVIFALLLSAFSCSSIDCPIQTSVEVKYQVCQFEAGEVVGDTLADTLFVLTRISNGKDTVLLNRGIDLTTFSLPVSYQRPADTLTIVLAHKTGVWTADTVWMQKDDIPHFESVDCPAHFFHRITAVRSTHHGIDSIAIGNPSVTYDPEITNINISFK